MKKRDYMNSGIEEKTQKKIVGILQVLFPGVKIYLYGSRARGTFKENSDIDLALDFGTQKKQTRLGEARAVLESLSIPYKFDIIDLHFTSKEMQKIIREEGILWNA
jgi:predicted nucleotidyltransferase